VGTGGTWIRHQLGLVALGASGVLTACATDGSGQGTSEPSLNEAGLDGSGLDGSGRDGSGLDGSGLDASAESGSHPDDRRDASLRSEAAPSDAASAAHCARPDGSRNGGDPIIDASPGELFDGPVDVGCNVDTWQDFYPDLRECSFSGTEFPPCNGASLPCKFDPVNMRNADLRGANFRNARWRLTDLTGANLAGANLSAASLGELAGCPATLPASRGWRCVKQSTTSVDGAPQYAIVGPGVRLENLNLDGTDLSGVNLNGANFTLARANRLTGCPTVPSQYACLSEPGCTYFLVGPMMHLSGDYGGADLSNRNVTNASLDGAVLRNVNLSDSDLSGSTLGEADLTGANLSGAILTRTETAGLLGCPAVLPDSRYRCVATPMSLFAIVGPGLLIEGYSLAGSDLSNVSFAGAQLGSIDLAGANLTGADFGSTVFSAPSFPWTVYPASCPAVLPGNTTCIPPHPGDGGPSTAVLTID